MPAVLEFTDDTEDELLAAIITNLDPTLTSFKLAPAYILYMATRYKYLNYIIFFVTTPVQVPCEHPVQTRDCPGGASHEVDGDPGEDVQDVADGHHQRPRQQPSAKSRILARKHQRVPQLSHLGQTCSLLRSRGSGMSSILDRRNSNSNISGNTVRDGEDDISTSSQVTSSGTGSRYSSSDGRRCCQ